MTCKSALPTFGEIPAARPDAAREINQFLRLTLIPRDDADLRAAACAVLVDFERQDISVGSAERHKSLLVDLSVHPAHTPGGVAWKIAEALEYFADEDHWVWWRYLLQSALVDAIEQERARQAHLAASSGDETTDPAVALWQRWAGLQLQAEGLPPTRAGDKERSRLCDEWCDASRALSQTPATSLRRVAAKLRVLEAEMDAGRATDGRDVALARGAREDIERLAGAP